VNLAKDPGRVGVAHAFGGGAQLREFLTFLFQDSLPYKYEEKSVIG
jgi:hypothetical protein